jgi:putative nucleotidyltransferase with HDIG domain
VHIAGAQVEGQGAAGGGAPRIAAVARGLHGEQLKGALAAAYDVSVHADAGAALVAVGASPPSVVVLDASMDGARDFMARIRRSPGGGRVSVLVAAPPPGDEWRAMGADAVLVKPYRRSALLAAVAAALRAAVERNWDDLPADSRKAVRFSAACFRDLADDISHGNPIVYAEVADACSPLVEVVADDQHRSMLSGIRDHDNYSFVHSVRVATLLTILGRAVGLGRGDQLLLATAGLLHDVGKIAIPHDVLNKPGRLSGGEWEVMRSHVSASVHFLAANEGIPKTVLAMAGQHHEKLDGSGYPRGMSGGQINELARMISIVDVFSALTDRRAYKAAMAPERATAIMKEQMAGAHLDGGMVRLFEQVLLDTGGGAA